MKFWNFLNILKYFFIGAFIGILPSILAWIIYPSTILVIMILFVFGALLLIIFRNKIFKKENVNKLNIFLLIIFNIFSLIIIILYITFGTVYFRIYEGDMFSYGPFIGKIFNKNDLIYLNEDDRLKYNNGYFIIYNRTDNEAPIISYITENNNIKWAIELKDPYCSECKYLSEVDLLEIEKGFLRDKIVFTTQAEYGYIYIWKIIQFNRFYVNM